MKLPKCNRGNERGISLFLLLAALAALCLLLYLFIQFILALLDALGNIVTPNRGVGVDQLIEYIFNLVIQKFV